MSSSPSYSSFLSLHQQQLEAAHVPPTVWQTLYRKLVSESFDAGASLSFELDESRPLGLCYSLVAVAPIARESTVFLVDHMWTFESDENVRQQLRHLPSLRQRLVSLLELDIEHESHDDDDDDDDDDDGNHGDHDNDNDDDDHDEIDEQDAEEHDDDHNDNDDDADEAAEATDVIDDPEHNLTTRDHEQEDLDATIESIVQNLWRLQCSITSDDGRSLYYVLDEVGSRLTPALVEHAAFQCVPLLNRFTNELVSIFWPIRDVALGERATCVGIPNASAKRHALRSVLACFDPRRAGNALRLGNDAALSSSSSSSSSSSAEASVLARFRQRLVDGLGYTVSNVAQALALDDHHTLPVWCFTASVRQSLIASLRAATDREPSISPRHLDLAIRFFLLNDSLSLATLEALFDAEIVALLERFGLITRLGCHTATDPAGLRSSLVQLVPLTGIANVLIATDFFHNGGAVSRAFHFDPVMYVGTDTVGLLAVVPPHHASSSDTSTTTTATATTASILDLCSGCGVQAIANLATNRHSRATTVELNPRAIRFAHFNALLNDVHSRITILHQDVLLFMQQAAAADKFDLLLANPPYIPSAGARDGALAKFGDGGRMGDDILAAIVANLPRLLHTGHGRFYIVSNLVNIEHYSTIVHDWLLRSPSLSVDPELDLRVTASVLHGDPWTPLQYAALILSLPESHSQVQEYANGLAEAGVTSVANGFVIGRLHHGDARSSSAITISQTLVDPEVWLAVARNPSLLAPYHV